MIKPSFKREARRYGVWPLIVCALFLRIATVTIPPIIAKSDHIKRFAKNVTRTVATEIFPDAIWSNQSFKGPSTPS